MWKFKAAGDGDNPPAFALGGLARDLTDDEYDAAETAGLLSDEARELFEHVEEKPPPPLETRKPKSTASADEAGGFTGKDGD